MSSGRKRPRFADVAAKSRKRSGPNVGAVDKVLEKFMGSGSAAPGPVPQEPASYQIPPSSQEPPTSKESPPRKTPTILEKPGVSGTSYALSQAGGVSQEPPAQQAGEVDIQSHFTKVPFTWIDCLCADTDPYTQAVYLQLLRLSWGHKRDWCTIGYPRLCERANVSESQARRSIKTLLRRGLIERLDVDMSGKNMRDWGVRWRVRLPEGTPVREIGGSRQTPPTPKKGGVSQAPMIERKKEVHESAPHAPTAVQSLDEKIRTKATILRELHKGDDEYTRDRFAYDLRLMLRADGLEPDESLIDDATEGR